MTYSMIEFTEKINSYEELIKENEGSIIDGVTDEEEYINSKIKIAWFLKEPYGSETTGYHIKEYYGQENSYENFFKFKATQTWHPIIYASYGILNDFEKFNDMNDIQDEPSMCEVINKIAIINANKMPSKTGTFTLSKNLIEGFDRFKNIILQQIEVLNPEIFIFANTSFLYRNILGLTEEYLITTTPPLQNCKIWEKDSKLYIAVYHPANRVMSRELYVDQIIFAANEWNKRKIEN